MDPRGSEPTRAGAQTGVDDIKRRLGRVERRDWWLWATAVVVMLLLAAAVVSTSLPSLLYERAGITDQAVTRAVSGLFGLVLLFSVFVIYQQVLIKKLRRNVADQLTLLATLETKAEVFEKLATSDALTGLLNRRFLSDHLPVELARADRYHYPFSVLMLDVRGLQSINDMHGNSTGDKALVEFSKAIRRAVRSSDLPVRLGDSQFLVLLPECGPEGIPPILSRLNRCEVQTLAGYSVQVEFAAGWCTYRTGENGEQLLRRVEEQLQADKRSGGSKEQLRKVEAYRLEQEGMQVVGRLARDVIHEFNNVLTVISGYSKAILDRVTEDEVVHSHVDEIIRATRQASELTRRLVSLTRKELLEPELLNMNAVISGLEPTVRRLLGEHIQLAVMVSSSRAEVVADRQQLEHLIVHLAAGARDAMTQGGRLSIQTGYIELDNAFVQEHPGSRPGMHSWLAFTDTGKPVDPIAATLVFDVTREPESSYGLIFADRLVKQLGGYIACEGERGLGTTITIYLPCKPPKVRMSREVGGPKKASSDLAEALRTHANRTVLLIESVSSIRKLFADELTRLGFSVLAAENGPQALSKVIECATPPRLAIVSLPLSGMSCNELAERLNALHKGVEVGYICSIPSDAESVAESSAQFILRKPFALEDLAHQIYQVFERSAVNP